MTATHHRPTPVRGRHHDRYWEYVARGELRFQQCGECRHLRYPPAPVCPECLAAAHTWARSNGRGRVLAWTVFHRQYFPELPPPYTVAAIETEEGPIVIGNLVGPAATETEHGMRVRAVYEVVGDQENRWHICQWTSATSEHQRQRSEA